MNRRLVCLLAIAGVASAAGATLSGASAAFWQVSTQADFLKGDAIENVAIDSDGRLTLGPATTTLHELTAPFAWALITAPDGSALVGMGNNGQVVRVSRDGASSVAFDAPELEVHAVADGPDGSLYAATSPDGRIYKVARDGSSSTVLDPEEKYIWALAVARDGTLFAGTGEKGVVYRIGADGHATPFYSTKATNVTALAFDRQGDLLVGTESPGQVLRVDREGKGFVLLDSPYREIHALRTDATGTVYAVAVSGRVPGPAQPTTDRPAETVAVTPTASVSTEITITAIGDASMPSTTTAAPSRPDTRRDTKGAVYRIAPDNLWDIAWQSSDDTPYDVLLDGPGRFYVATGAKGKIFRVSSDPVRTTLVARVAAQQATVFARGPSGTLLVATANPGKLYRLSPSDGTRGVYESDVRDATTVASWGTIRWHAILPAGSSVEVSTRSGNTGTPDETWSAWSSPYTDAAGAAISSPNARYLQWRAVLAGTRESPALTSVNIAYLPRNVRPVVDSITVHPPGVVFQRPFSTGEQELAGFETGTSDGRPMTSAPPTPAAAPALGRKTFQKGLETFVWKASDENDDRLQYDVSYRREGEPGWKVLKRGLWDPIFTWDTTSVPDGTYTIKVSASDAPSSSPATALVGELESASFDVDNTPPVIERQAGRADGTRAVVTFRVRDAQSPVQRVEYSLDASRWRTLYPRDGVADSRIETYDITLEAGDGDAIVRATDALSNVATAVVGRK